MEKSDNDLRVKELVDLTIGGAREAAREVEKIKYLYIKDAETYGGEETERIIKEMSKDEVYAISEAFAEVVSKINEIKGIFYHSRKA